MGELEDAWNWVTGLSTRDFIRPIISGTAAYYAALANPITAPFALAMGVTVGAAGLFDHIEDEDDRRKAEQEYEKAQQEYWASLPLSQEEYKELIRKESELKMVILEGLIRNAQGELSPQQQQILEGITQQYATQARVTGQKIGASLARRGLQRSPLAVGIQAGLQRDYGIQALQARVQQQMAWGVGMFGGGKLPTGDGTAPTTTPDTTPSGTVGSAKEVGEMKDYYDQWQTTKESLSPEDWQYHLSIMDPQKAAEIRYNLGEIDQNEYYRLIGAMNYEQLMEQTDTGRIAGQYTGGGIPGDEPLGPPDLTQYDKPIGPEQPQPGTQYDYPIGPEEPGSQYQYPIGPEPPPGFDPFTLTPWGDKPPASKIDPYTIAPWGDKLPPYIGEPLPPVVPQADEPPFTPPEILQPDPLPEPQIEPIPQPLPPNVDPWEQMGRDPYPGTPGWIDPYEYRNKFGTYLEEYFNQGYVPTYLTDEQIRSISLESQLKYYEQQKQMGVMGQEEYNTLTTPIVAEIENVRGAPSIPGGGQQGSFNIMPGDFARLQIPGFGERRRGGVTPPSGLSPNINPWQQMGNTTQNLPVPTPLPAPLPPNVNPWVQMGKERQMPISRRMQKHIDKMTQEGIIPLARLDEEWLSHYTPEERDLYERLWAKQNPVNPQIGVIAQQLRQGTFSGELSAEERRQLPSDAFELYNNYLGFSTQASSKPLPSNVNPWVQMGRETQIPPMAPLTNMAWQRGSAPNLSRAITEGQQPPFAVTPGRFGQLTPEAKQKLSQSPLYQMFATPEQQEAFNAIWERQKARKNNTVNNFGNTKGGGL